MGLPHMGSRKLPRLVLGTRMKLTQAHGEAFGYWKTGPTLRKLAKMKEPNIHRLINYHAGIKPDTTNTLVLVAMRRKNGDTLVRQLFELTEWDRHNMPKRYFAYRRWQEKYWERKARNELRRG